MRWVNRMLVGMGNVIMNAKPKKDHMLFYAAYFMYIAGLFIDILPDTVSINSEGIKKGVKFIAVVLLMINSCYCYVKCGGFRYKKAIDRKSIFKKMVLMGLFLFVLMVALLSKDFYLLALILFGISIRDLEMDELFKMSFWILSFLTCLVLFLCLLGVLPNIQLVRSTSYHYGRPRYSLGFAHSLYLPDILVYLAAYFYTSKKKMKVLDFVLFQCLGILVYMFCDSRNGLIALELLLFVVLLWQLSCKIMGNKMGIFQKMLRLISSISFPSVTLLGLFLLWAYQKHMPFAITINSVLSNRLLLAHTNMEQLPFQILRISSYQEFLGQMRYVYDNGYYYLLARYGYLIMLIFLSVSVAAVECMKKEENHYAMLVFIVIAMLNFIDNGFVSYAFLPYMILGICGMYSRVNIASKSSC